MFQKGHKKVGGIKKGSTREKSRSIKAAFEAAFEGLGGVDKLQAWAMANPTEFYKLASKLIPLDVRSVSEVVDRPLDTSKIPADELVVLSARLKQIAEMQKTVDVSPDGGEQARG